MMAERCVMFTNEYIKRRRPSRGSGHFNYNKTGNQNHTRRNINDLNQQTDNAAIQFPARNTWNCSARKVSFNSFRGRSFDQYQNQSTNRNDDTYYRYGYSGNSRGTWKSYGTYPRSPSGLRQDPRQNRQYQLSRPTTTDHSAFRQLNGHELSGFGPHDQRFPIKNDQLLSNASRFAATED